MLTFSLTGLRGCLFLHQSSSALATDAESLGGVGEILPRVTSSTDGGNPINPEFNYVQSTDPQPQSQSRRAEKPSSKDDNTHDTMSEVEPE